MDKIISENIDHTLFLTLNFPDKLNCIGMEMLRQLNTVFTEAGSNDDIRAVVLQGAGDRAFSTGADIKEFEALEEDEINEWIEFGNRVFNNIEHFPKPIIALIHGFALGGGLELALACDLRIATEDAVFSSPELQHGWLPGWGGITRLKRLVGEAHAKEIIFLSEKISAEKALAIGLVHRVIDGQNIEDELNAILEILHNIQPEIFELGKRALMDHNRTTYGSDLAFDVLAAHYAKKLAR